MDYFLQILIIISKKITFFVTLALQNLFQHSSSGSFSVENILITPHPIFIYSPATFERSIFYFNSVGTLSLKSVIVKDFIFSMRPAIILVLIIQIYFQLKTVFLKI
jgi:hypothetical protein